MRENSRLIYNRCIFISLLLIILFNLSSSSSNGYFPGHERPANAFMGDFLPKFEIYKDKEKHIIESSNVKYSPVPAHAPKNLKQTLIRITGCIISSQKKYSHAILRLSKRICRCIL